MYARIQNGAVAEISKAEANPAAAHHPSMTWVQVPLEWRALIGHRCRWTGDAFLPPVQIAADGSPILDAQTGEPLTDFGWLSTRAIAGIRAFAADARAQAALGADPIEIATWPAKEAMAKRHQAAATDTDDNDALQAEADLRGETVADLVTLILAKAAAFKVAAGKIKGWQNQAETHVATEAANGNATALVMGLATLKAQAAAELETLLQQLQA